MVLTVFLNAFGKNLNPAVEGSPKSTKFPKLNANKLSSPNIFILLPAPFDNGASDFVGP